MRDEEFKHHWRNLPALYAIINIDEHDNPAVFAGELLDAGISIIQLRNKKLGEIAFEQCAAEILKLRNERNRAVKVLINDSVPIAARLAADGVHLGQTDGDPRLARATLGAQALIGLSTHNEAQLFAAPAEVLSYIAVGPIFHSDTKNGHAEVVGTERLQSLSRASTRPLVAIGGINREKAAAVFNAGAWSLAMVSHLRQCSPAALHSSMSEIRESAQRSGAYAAQAWQGAF